MYFYNKQDFIGTYYTICLCYIFCTYRVYKIILPIVQQKIILHALDLHT